MILDNRRITIERLMPSNFYVFLGMKCATAKIVLKLLNFEQKYLRMDIAREMLTTFNNDPDLLKTAITGDQ